MAQASNAQREPSMEEILASIRRIIEDNDAASRKQANEPAPVRAIAAERPVVAERTVIEVDAFRGELHAQPVEPVHEDLEPEPVRHKPSLADIQAQIAAEAAAMPTRWIDPEPQLEPEPELAPVVERPAYQRSPDDIRRAIENSRAAREDARALLGLPEPANTARPVEAHVSEPAPAPVAEIEDRPQFVAPVRYAENESVAPKPTLLSERVERQVAASFSELSEAFAARSRKTFDEMAEEMIAPLLRDWMENNLPMLVERLVREEIERVARGS
ncbi:MAG: DUF2497 domain-containing protein [Mesorhizobium sp.]|nr:DUF2497 domain-containing protein [Mesorhizobium sp.]MBL8576164.1 DUF2497 domain-containing protein [Mesorhizobium sp.]